MDDEYAQHILRNRERYPEWFSRLIERDGASFYAKIRTSAQELLASPALRSRLHRALAKTDIRGGVDRTLEVIEHALRIAEEH